MNTLTESPRYSCALGGALSTAKALHRVIPILHCGPGCGMMLYNGQNFIAGYAGGGYIGGTLVPSTNTYERDIVFGAEKRLKQIISSSVELLDGDLYLVLTGYTADIIGDDVPAVIAEFAERHVPVAFALSGGFNGTNYHGYERVWDALARQVAAPVPRDPRLVNLFGIVPAQDVFWQGNAEEIARLLAALGLTVNTFMTDRQGIEQVRRSAGAALNIILSPWVAEGVAARYKKRFGVPSVQFPGVPIGPTATAEFLRGVTSALELDATATERLIAQEMGVPHLSISFPVTDRLILNRALAGYRGSIALVEDFITPCVAAL